MEKFLKYTIYTALALLLFTPLIVMNEMYFPYITGKNFAFRVLVEVMVAAWAILAITDARYRPKFSWILGAFGGFVAVMLLAALFGVNTYDSIWSNFERMEGWVTLLHLLGLLVVVGTMLTSKKQWKRLFLTSTVAATIVALHALGQMVDLFDTNRTRLIGTIGNATYLAAYMLFHIFLAGWLGWERMQERIARAKSWFDIGVLAYGVGILLFALILYNTATRGAMLGLVGGFGLTALLIALFADTRPRLRKTAASLIVLLVLLVGGFLAVRNTTFVQETPGLARFANIDLQGQTVRSRFMVWDMAWQGFVDRPILGWGQGNFNYIFNTYYNPQMYDQEEWFDRAHNVVLDWLTGGGILGFILYISLFFFAVYYIWYRRKGWQRVKERVASWFSYIRPEFDPFTLSVVEKAVFTGLLAAYFFHNLFVFDNITSYMMFVLVLAFLHATVAREWELFGTDVPSQRMRQAGILGVLIVFVGSVYLFNYNGYMQSRTLIDALRLRSSGQLQESFQAFDTALAYDSYGTQEVREQLLQLAVTLASVEDVSPELKEQFFNRAKTEMEQQIAEDPIGTRHEYFLGLLLHRYGMPEKAEEHFARAVELSPQKQTILFELGVVHLKQREFDQAFEVLQTAYEGAPEYTQAQELYATAAIYADQFESAEGISQRLDQKLHDAQEAGKPINESWVEDLAEFHVFLASAYARAEDFDRAIIEVQRAIKVLPAFEQQGRQYIQQLRRGEIPGEE